MPCDLWLGKHKVGVPPNPGSGAAEVAAGLPNEIPVVPAVEVAPSPVREKPVDAVVAAAGVVPNPPNPAVGAVAVAATGAPGGEELYMI